MTDLLDLPSLPVPLWTVGFSLVSLLRWDADNQRQDVQEQQSIHPSNSKVKLKDVSYPSSSIGDKANIQLRTTGE